MKGNKVLRFLSFHGAMFVCIDKPTGYTSYDIVEKVKRIYTGEKVGHGGTLDPMATGLLVIGIGKDTKQLARFLDAKKTYHATIDFSKASDTWDMDYRKDYTEYVISDGKIQKDDKRKSFPSRETVEEYLQEMITTTVFPLTPFSAKKVNGKKLYEYARAGAPLFLQTPMRVYTCTLVTYAFPLLEIELEVGSGTYIRSLAHRLGSKLGIGGILIQLARTKVGQLLVPTV